VGREPLINHVCMGYYAVESSKVLCLLCLQQSSVPDALLVQPVH
jgi:hypothetical protein